VNGHISIGAGARVAAQAGVFGDLEGGVEYLGFPARPRVEALRALAAARRMPRLLEELRELGRRVRAIEEERT
jgi:UDP-3-O-[3-hydroxymyristoyl] glucosamine N-acyltransferase